LTWTYMMRDRMASAECAGFRRNSTPRRSRGEGQIRSRLRSPLARLRLDNGAGNSLRSPGGRARVPRPAQQGSYRRGGRWASARTVASQTPRRESRFSRQNRRDAVLLNAFDSSIHAERVAVEVDHPLEVATDLFAMVHARRRGARVCQHAAEGSGPRRSAAPVRQWSRPSSCVEIWPRISPPVFAVVWMLA
jgi:hypothetical protein